MSCSYSGTPLLSNTSFHESECCASFLMQGPSDDGGETIFTCPIPAPECRLSSLPCPLITHHHTVFSAISVQIRVLYFVGRGLLKEDRPTFALHLVHGMHPGLFQPVRISGVLLSCPFQRPLPLENAACFSRHRALPVALNSEPFHSTFVAH